MSPGFNPRKPDYNLRVMRRSGAPNKGTIGAAWQDEDGRIHIQLEPWVVLEQKEELVLTLFPREEKK